MSRCIVCGVDSSGATSEAILFARDLSSRLGLRLVLVNAARVPVVAGASGIPHAYEDLRRDAIDKSAELLERMSEEHGLTAATERKVELGDPVKRLTAVAEEEGAELLVVGSRGRGRLASALLGSVSAAVAATAPCPVVIVPSAAAIKRGAPAPKTSASPRRARRKGGALGVPPARTGGSR